MHLPCAKSPSNASLLAAVLVDRFFPWCLVARREERRKRGREKREKRGKKREGRKRERELLKRKKEIQRKKGTIIQTTPRNTPTPNTNTTHHATHHATHHTTQHPHAHTTPTAPRTTDRDHANAIYDTFVTPVMSVMSASCHRHVDHAPSGAIKFEDIVRCECNSDYSLDGALDGNKRFTTTCGVAASGFMVASHTLGSSAC